MGHSKKTTGAVSVSEKSELASKLEGFHQISNINDMYDSGDGDFSNNGGVEIDDEEYFVPDIAKLLSKDIKRIISNKDAEIKDIREALHIKQNELSAAYLEIHTKNEELKKLKIDIESNGFIFGLMKEKLTAPNITKSSQYMILTSFITDVLNIQPTNQSMFVDNATYCNDILINLIYVFYDHKEIVKEVYKRLLGDTYRYRKESYEYTLGRDCDKAMLMHIISNQPTICNGAYYKFEYGTFPNSQPYTEYLSNPLLFGDEEVTELYKTKLLQVLSKKKGPVFPYILGCLTSVKLEVTDEQNNKFNEIMSEIFDKIPLSDFSTSGLKLIKESFCTPQNGRPVRYGYKLSVENQIKFINLIKYDIIQDTTYRYPFCMEAMLLQLKDVDIATTFEFLKERTDLKQDDIIRISLYNKSPEEIVEWVNSKGQTVDLSEF